MRTRLVWPYLGGLLVLMAVPLVGAVAIAFTEYAGVSSPQWAGLANFRRLLGDEMFWQALGNSAVFVVLSVPLRVLGAVGLALLLAHRAAGIGAARAAVYLPSVVPDAAFALLWLWVLNPLYGPLAAAFRSVGIGNPGFLTDPWATRASFAVMAAFQVGEGFIVVLAARRALPASLYEAAAVDGVSPWRQLTRLTLPLLAPVLALLALRDVVLSFQATFVPSMLITDGGPHNATLYLPLLAYRQGFRYFRLGYASAISLTMLLITAAVVWMQWRLARRWRLL